MRAQRHGIDAGEPSASPQEFDACGPREISTLNINANAATLAADKNKARTSTNVSIGDVRALCCGWS